MLATGVTSQRKQQSEAQPPSGSEARIFQQVEKLEQRLIATQKQGDLYEESRLCNNIAKKYEQLGEWIKALHFHHYDKQISIAAGDVEGCLMALNNLAHVCLSLELTELGEKFFSEQLEMALQYQNMPQAFRAYAEKGNLKLLNAERVKSIPIAMKESLDDAGIFFFKAHESLDSYDAMISAGLLASNRKEEMKSLRLEARLNDGRLLILRENWEGALGKARSVLDESANAGIKFQALGIMGQAYSALKEPSQAVEVCFDQQLKIAKDEGNKALECEALLNLGVAYRNLLDYELSLQTLYLYKDHLKTRSLDTSLLHEAGRIIEETLKLKDLAEKVSVAESAMDCWPAHDKRYLKLAQDCSRLGAPRDALGYLKEFMKDPGQSKNAKALRLAVTLCLELKITEEAIIFSKRLYEAVSGKGLAVEEVEALMSISDAYSLLPTLPGETLMILQKALELSQERNLEELEPLVLSKLATTYQAIGMDQSYLELKEKCLALVMRGQDDLLKNREIYTIERELQELDYFVNRKPSKSVMNLVDGNFNMTSRSRGLRGLVIKKTRKKAEGLEAEKPRIAHRRKRALIIDVDAEDEANLADFIVDDEAKGPDSKVKEKAKLEAKGMTSKKRLLPRPKVTGPSTPPRDVIEVDDLPPGPIWPPSPKKSTRSLVVEEQRSVSGGSRRTWGSGDPAMGLTSVTRLYVVIEGETLIVPVIEDITEHKTIAWLIEEVTRRYESDFGQSPIIDALLTEEGARLGAKDALRIVLGDGQKVMAKVMGYRSKTLLQVYREQCAGNGVVEDPMILNLLTDQKLVDLSSWCFDGNQFELLVRALVEYKVETETSTGLSSSGRVLGQHAQLDQLNLSNNEYVTDDIIQTIAKVQGLRRLDLSFTLITRISFLPACLPGLEVLSLAFCQGITDLADFVDSCWRNPECKLRVVDLSGLSLVGASLGDWHFLESLESVDVSFCQADGTFVESLARLIKKSTTLTRISLHGCQLAEQQIDPIVSALEENYFLTELDLAGNSLSRPLTARLLDIKERNPRSCCKILLGP